MTKPTSPIRESTLAFNLNDEAHNFVRELAMASRKMSIYGGDHPLALKAVEKPFFVLSAIFKYKVLVNLNMRRGELNLLNIRLKDSPFTAQIVQLLQALDVNAVVFERRMRINDFAYFAQTMVDRQTRYNTASSLPEQLVRKEIDTIQINSERGYHLFEDRRQYRGDVEGDFSVKRFALDQLGDDPIQLARVNNTNEQGLLEYGIDFDPAIVGYLIPEKMASFDALRVRQVLVELADRITATGSGPKRTYEATADYMALFKLVEYHPEKSKITADLDSRRDSSAVGQEGESFTESGAIKVQASAQIDQQLERLFSPVPDGGESEAFTDTFIRLMKTGQQPKAIEVLGRLLDLMSAPDPDCRQRALNILGQTTAELGRTADTIVLEEVTVDIITRLRAGSETFEYSEFLWQLFEACRDTRRYDLAAKLTAAMATRRKVDGNVTVYDSMAVKKGFENIGRRIIVEALVKELITAGGETAAQLKDILVAIGSEEIALALSQIISHPQRSVRQLTLKILAELGRSSLRVFARILDDNAMFERDHTRHELPDEKWYVVRNSIFVLGSLRDSQGVEPLRLRIDDKDVRVRREIVTALEKIGGDEAIDCLTLMAEDPIGEVREAAVVAIGLVGRAESAPILIDIAQKEPRNSVKVVAALGKLGGPDARQFLGKLLNDPEAMSALSKGVVSKDDLRVAAVKALGQIGDPDAIDHVRKFRDSQSAAQKLLMKNSAVNRAVTEVLARH
jgi:HEAT repeat protein